MESPTTSYTLLRESIWIERMFFIFHRFGIQSNVLVAARYNDEERSNRKLTKSMVIAALHAVVTAHPQLGLVGVIRPSPKPGLHNLHRALLSEVDIESQVEFLDEEDDLHGDAELFSSIHNQWDFVKDDPDRPWWRVRVKGGRHVIFYFHHFVCDGVSGSVFHRELLRALNTQSAHDVQRLNAKPWVYFDPQTCVVPKPSYDVLPVPKATLWCAYKFLAYILVDMFLRAWTLFGDLKYTRVYPKVFDSIATSEQRTDTAVALYRIPAKRMAPILAGCRKNGATFTTLLNTMWFATLSKDFYPGAILTMTRITADVRPYISLEAMGGATASGVMTNSAMVIQEWFRLAPFRRLISLVQSHEVLDVAETWKLARIIRQTIAQGIRGNSLIIWGQSRYMSTDLEDMANQMLAVVGLSNRHSRIVSNIGAFEGTVKGPWSVSDLQFSAGVTNGKVGGWGIDLNVAGVKGRDTVIVADYERGVVSDAMAKEALERTVARMEALVREGPLM